MGRAFFLLIVAFLFIFLDWYTYNGLQSMFFHTRYVKLWKILYALVSGFTYLSIFYLMYSYSPGNTGQRNEYLNLMGGFVFTMFVTKMVFGGFLLLQDTGRLVYGGFQYVKFKLSDDVWSEDSFIPGRRMFLTSFATIAAGLPFFSLLFGITKGKYLYTVEKKVLSFKDLPDEFEGFNIVQISDIHAGSFDNKEKVRKGIDMINELNADVVCFTGDLVNSEKEEIDPYIDVFADIKAKYGKFAILGNHDYYGSYDRTRPEGEKLYFEDFYKKYEKWDLPC
ncbi:MAG: metallophosphoesterase [Saprospiraceae bacterium]|nr:metallophosphoesterase [Saprospiraceae bacterium]